jgi:DNA-binding transcriptional LysR family regulator
MHRRHQQLNIPIEIVRTVVAVSETGSLSKAGERLGLSQPAVSSQIKRIQNMVGGALFNKTANGSVPTDLGKLVLNQSRRILEANDQMLRLGGAAEGPQPLRLGISTLLVREFLRAQDAAALSDIMIHADHSAGITRGVIDGYIDVACIFDNLEIGPELTDLIAKEYEEPFVWVRSKNFVLRPGAPIPILTWFGDDMMIRLLTRHGLQYRIAFDTSDHRARLAAVEAGLGVTVVPERLVPPYLTRAREYYLPKVPPVKALICLRSGLESDAASKLLVRLSALFSKNQAADIECGDELSA